MLETSTLETSIAIAITLAIAIAMVDDTDDVDVPASLEDSTGPTYMICFLILLYN
jgi:hypothetical protein